MDIDVLDQQVVRELASIGQTHCVTIFMPSHPTGAAARENPIRLKNLVDAVEEKLRDRDLKKTQIDAMLKGVRELSSNSEFWQRQGNGLAIFIAEGSTRVVRLPRAVDEIVHVGPHFWLKPLFASAASGQTCFALLFTKKRARLMRCGEHLFEEIQNDLFPVSLEEVAGVRDGQDQLQRENSLNPSGAIGQRGGASFHGHGIVEGRRLADLEHFASDVAKRADTVMGGNGGTVIIVGDVQTAAMVEERFPRHGSATVIKRLVVTPDGISEHDLQQRCWELLSEHAKEDVSRLLDRFGTAASESRAVEGVEQLAIPAAQGRVETLILDPRYERMGTIAPDLSEVHVGNGSNNGSAQQAEDLVNRSVIDTLLNSGRIVPLEADVDSDPVPPKAILRY